MTKKGQCAIPQCRNSSEKTAGIDVIYQKFPLKEKTRRRWIRTIQATFESFSADGLISPRLCSDHFESSNFIVNKHGKRIFKFDAVPTIFISNVPKKTQPEIVVRPRHPSRRAASKEALKQMQILLEDEADDPVEIPDDDDHIKGEIHEEEVPPVPVVVTQLRKKYKLTHRKSSDGNDREVLVLKTITTPNITNPYVENNLELECWVEELEPCQKERNAKLEEEEKALQSKLDELIKLCNGEVIYKGDLTTVIEVSEHVQKTIQAVQASHNKAPIVLNNTVANPQPGYQLVMDPRLGLIVGATVGAVPAASQPAPKPGKIQVATNLQAPTAPITPASQGASIRGRLARTKKQVPVTQPSPQPPTPIATRSLLSQKQNNKRPAPPPPPVPPPATRSRGSEPTPQQIVPASKPVTRSRGQSPAAAPTATPIATRPRPGTVVTSVRPTETSVEGGLTTGTNLKPKAIVDLTSDDGRPLPDSREVSFNKLQGKTFPSLVVVARPHLRVSDVNSDRAKLDAKVKAVLMYAPTKFTEWLIQQGLVKSEQKCSMHPTTQLKLGMYSDVSKFPYSGGYVWISECCPQRFVSVFSGSLFEGSPHPPLVILKILYHWACQTNIQNVTQWVKVDNLYVKGMYTWLRSICTVALQTHIRQLGGPQTKVEVGVISLGTTSQDGNSRQVKVEVLGILETTTKLIRLRAIEPLADGDRNYKKRFSKILEPLSQWVLPSSIIVTDLTVDKATLHQMGFSTVIQSTSVESVNSNRTIMEYLRRIVPRMFQNTLSLLSRQIIQQFLDELVWREWFGTTSMLAFDNLVTHLAEQTRHESNQTLSVRLNRVALNPFKSWGIPSSGSTVVPGATPAPVAKNVDISTKKRKRKELEPQPKPTPPAQLELNRPPKSTSPDVPEQMVPLENYYYGTIDNYPPKTNVTLNLKCPFCKEIYNNNIILMSHLFKHAHNVSKDGQMCRYCLTSVPTANDLLKHIATAHPSETKHDNGFVCLICETQYMNPFVLGKHMSKEHCPSELPYQCGTCGYRCSNHKQAIDHFYKQHDNGPTIQCPFCLKSTTVFSSSRNIAQNMHFFIQHLQKHQRKQFARRCGKCNSWFVQKDVLKDHQTKMHASQRGKTGLVPWVAPTRNGVMVPKSKMDKYPCDAEGINFTTLFYTVSKRLKCKECDGVMDSTKHFPSFESCQNPNCQYSTCCSNAMQEHNAKCSKSSQSIVPPEKLPCDMFCICGYSSQDGNQMAKHLALCEKKSAYPSVTDAKSASVTHSMLDVLGLVRKPDEKPTSQEDKKPSARSRTLKRGATRSAPETISLDEDVPMENPEIKTEKEKKEIKVEIEKMSKVMLKGNVELTDADETSDSNGAKLKDAPKATDELGKEPTLKNNESEPSITEVTAGEDTVEDTDVRDSTPKEDLPIDKTSDHANEDSAEKNDEVELANPLDDSNNKEVEGDSMDVDDADTHPKTDSEDAEEKNNDEEDAEKTLVESDAPEEEMNDGNITLSDASKDADLIETPNAEPNLSSEECEPDGAENSVSESKDTADADSESDIEEVPSEDLTKIDEPAAGGVSKDCIDNSDASEAIQDVPEETPETCSEPNEIETPKDRIGELEEETAYTPVSTPKELNSELEEETVDTPVSTPKERNISEVEGETVDTPVSTPKERNSEVEGETVDTPVSTSKERNSEVEGETVDTPVSTPKERNISEVEGETVDTPVSTPKERSSEVEGETIDTPVSTPKERNSEVEGETVDTPVSTPKERSSEVEGETVDTPVFTPKERSSEVEGETVNTPLSIESNETTNIISESHDPEISDNVTEKDDVSQQSNVSNWTENVQSTDESASFPIAAISSDVLSKGPGTPETLPLESAESKERGLETEGVSKTQDDVQPMDFEDISTSGLDTITAMETD